MYIALAQRHLLNAILTGGMIMAMSQKEFDANLKVQELKPKVNEAMAASKKQGGLTALSDLELSGFTAAVLDSIKYRSSLKTLGHDEGHEHRITVEQALLATLNAEVLRRKTKKDEEKRLQEDIRLKAMPNVLGDRPKGGPAWGIKK